MRTGELLLLRNQVCVDVDCLARNYGDAFLVRPVPFPGCVNNAVSMSAGPAGKISLPAVPAYPRSTNTFASLFCVMIFTWPGYAGLFSSPWLILGRVPVWIGRKQSWPQPNPPPMNTRPRCAEATGANVIRPNKPIEANFNNRNIKKINKNGKPVSTPHKVFITSVNPSAQKGVLCLDVNPPEIGRSASGALAIVPTVCGASSVSQRVAGWTRFLFGTAGQKPWA